MSEVSTIFHFFLSPVVMIVSTVEASTFDRVAVGSHVEAHAVLLEASILLALAPLFHLFAFLKRVRTTT